MKAIPQALLLGGEPHTSTACVWAGRGAVLVELRQGVLTALAWWLADKGVLLKKRLV